MKNQGSQIIRHLSTISGSVQRLFWSQAGFLTLACSLAGLMLVAGCSSVKMRADHGQVAASTFSFYNPGPRSLPENTEVRQQAHRVIQEAITKTMASKGVKQVASGGDVTVAYLLVVGNNVTTTSLNQYFGYSSDATALVSKVHEQQAVDSKNRAYFEAGELIIDLVDPQTSKLLQRRSIHAQLLRNLAPETRVERVQAIVDQALADVRISH